MLNGVIGFDTADQALAHVQEHYPGPDLAYHQLPAIIRAAFVHGTRGTQPPI